MKWYSEQGRDSDVVISTRIRLIRNLAGTRFPAMLSTEEKEAVCEKVRDALLEDKKELRYTRMVDLGDVKAVSLAERGLISPEFASDFSGRALITSDDESVSIMLCEDDHIKIRVTCAGLEAEKAFDKAMEIDSLLESRLDVAFDERIGYLTQYPNNLGTAMRASVIMHLPALGMDGHVAKLAGVVSSLGLTLSRVTADSANGAYIYQLSNQVTLGISEEAAISNLISIAKQIADREREARAPLVNDERMLDNIFRSKGILESARLLSYKEFTQLFSPIRLASAQGIIDVPLTLLDTLLVEMKPANLADSTGKKLSRDERDAARAAAVRERMKDCPSSK